MVPSLQLEAPTVVAAGSAEDRTALGRHRGSAGLVGLPRWAMRCRSCPPKRAELQVAHPPLEVVQFGHLEVPASVRSARTWTKEGPALLARGGLMTNPHFDKSLATATMVHHTHISRPKNLVEGAGIPFQGLSCMRKLERAVQ